MEIKKIGKYKLLKDFSIRNTIAGTKLFKGEIINITQIDNMRHKIIGKELMDWMFWDLPVKKITNK